MSWYGNDYFPHFEEHQITRTPMHHDLDSALKAEILERGKEKHLRLAERIKENAIRVREKKLEKEERDMRRWMEEEEENEKFWARRLPEHKKRVQAKLDRGEVKHIEYFWHSQHGALHDSHDQFSCNCGRGRCLRCDGMVKDCCYDEHWDEICPFRTVRCQYGCGEEFQYVNSGAHVDKCAKKPICMYRPESLVMAQCECCHRHQYSLLEKNNAELLFLGEEVIWWKFSLLWIGSRIDSASLFAFLPRDIITILVAYLKVQYPADVFYERERRIARCQSDPEEINVYLHAMNYFDRLQHDDFEVTRAHVCENRKICPVITCKELFSSAAELDCHRQNSCHYDVNCLACGETFARETLSEHSARCSIRKIPLTQMLYSMHPDNSSQL